VAQQGDAGEILDPFYYVVLVCCGTPLECLQVDVDVYLAKRHLLPQLQGVIRDVLTLGRMHDATKRGMCSFACNLTHYPSAFIVYVNFLCLLSVLSESLTRGRKRRS